jgi:hypothetical protein
MEMEVEELKKEFFAFLAFLAISARNCVEEPKLYGPLRLIDGASRLIEILEKAGIEDPFFQEIKEKIDQNKYTVMGDRNQFIQFLDDLTKDFSKKLKEEE